MSEWHKRIAYKMDRAKERIAKARADLTAENVEKKAKAAGKSAVEFTNDVLVGLEKALKELAHDTVKEAENLPGKAGKAAKSFHKNAHSIHQDFKNESHRLVHEGGLEKDMKGALDRAKTSLEKTERKLASLSKDVKKDGGLGPDAK